jgi:hypothetical protein
MQEEVGWSRNVAWMGEYFCDSFGGKIVLGT